MDRKIATRRRVLSILAVGAAIPFANAGRALAALEPYRWRGTALGAAADLTLYALDRGDAAAILDSCVKEIARLEAVFSLHQPDSALSRLNRDGVLADPPFELIELLSQALLLSHRSVGRFDPTVQPLWRLVAAHFARPDADPAGPDAGSLAAARALVDYRAVRLDRARISFARPGMQVTLNGIAQGYISDRIGTFLAGHGYRHALVNLGETLAIDRRADGGAWRIGIRSPIDPARVIEVVELVSGAVATSSANGLLFDVSGRFNHIVDPTSLRCAEFGRSVTVVADSCAIADGLSTVGTLLTDPKRDFPRYLRRYGASAYMLSSSEPTGHWLTT